jgi:hypothetical protein
MRRVHLLQEKMWPAYFGNLKASYSSIFLQNNEPSTQILKVNVRETSCKDGRGRNWLRVASNGGH